MTTGPTSGEAAISAAAKPLGEPRRVRLLRLLLESDTTLCGCELADILGAPDYQISRDLSALRQAGLVTDQGRSGTWVHYGPSWGLASVTDRLLTSVLEEVELAPVVKDRFALRLALRDQAGCILGAGHPDVLAAFDAAGLAEPEDSPQRTDAR